MVGAAVAGGGVFFTLLATDASWRQIAAATGWAAFAVLAKRFGQEGSRDTARAEAGQLIEGKRAEALTDLVGPPP